MASEKVILDLNQRMQEILEGQFESYRNILSYLSPAEFDALCLAACTGVAAKLTAKALLKLAGPEEVEKPQAKRKKR